MLASFCVLLTPEVPTPAGRSIGRSLHGLFFSLIAQANPELAGHLHDDDGLKPFTVSTLKGRWQRDGREATAIPGETYVVRYTVLTDDVFNALAQILLGKYTFDQPVEINGNPFRVEGIIVDSDHTRGWTGITSFQQLAAEARHERRIRLQFASPTTFHTGNVNLVFPLPTSVFGSYLRKWQAISDVELSGDLLDFIAEHIVAERHRLETRAVPYNARSQHNGFVGQCQYLVLSDDEERIRQVNLLADFALFAGTGQKTTHGLGQTRRINVLA